MLGVLEPGVEVVVPVAPPLATRRRRRGTAMRPGVIIAGTNIVATDHVGARVMGFDPQGDYPDHPFFYRRNAIKLAAEAGVGPNQPIEIKVLGPQPEEVAQKFTVERYEGESRRDDEIRARLSEKGTRCA